jgi:hypothetical protein
MPATRAKSLPPYLSLPPAKSTLLPPLYQRSIPSCMPLPFMRTALFYADEDELPTVFLKRTLPRRQVSFKDDTCASYCSVPRELPPRDISPLTESSESDDATPRPILKPDGEPGRPRSGGYNIEHAVDWNPSEFSRLKVSL